MKNSLKRATLTWLPIGIAGVIFAIPYLFWLNKQEPLQGLRAILIFLYLWFLFSLGVFFLWFRVLIPRLKRFSNYQVTWWLLGYLAAGAWLALNIPLRYPGGLNGFIESTWIGKILFLSFSGAGIGFVVFALSVIFAARNIEHVSTVRVRFRWAFFAMPMIGIWFVYLLAFWPGMMSADSIDQWGQIISGNFINHHPAFHTFTIWLVTRLSFTPASVALTQIIALGILGGLILANFETLGVQSHWLWLASFLLAFSPVNGSMVVTLWKDIPYSISLLGLTFLIFKSVISNGQWITFKYNWLVLGSTAALVALFRHNGLPVLVGIFPLLIFFFLKQWKLIVSAFALSMVLYFGIIGPVYQIARVEGSAILNMVMSLYDVAANSESGSLNDTILKSMVNLNKDWDCTITSSFENPDQNTTMDGKNDLQKAIRLIRYAPSITIYYYRCNRSLIWIIWDPSGEVRNPSHAEYWIDSNPYGITPDSKTPALRSMISNFVAKTSKDPQINWLVWRPALYLYLFLLATAVTALKHRNTKLFLIAGPILIQSISSTFIPMAPNFRYHYAAYLLALIFWPILFSKPGYEMTSQSKMDSKKEELG